MRDILGFQNPRKRKISDASKFRVVLRQTQREKKERAKTVSFEEGETKRVDPRVKVQTPQKTCTYMKRNVKKIIGLIGVHKR